MADYSKFKNANGDDLVLQDSRVDAISEKVEGIEAGAEVNKIESISIYDTELIPDENKNISIGLRSGTGGLEFNGNQLYVSVDDETIGISHWNPDLDDNLLYVKYNDDTITKAYNGISVRYDNNTIITDIYGLTVANPVPDADNANDGDVLTYNGNSDEIVWAAPQGGGSDLPAYTQSDAGKVLAVNQAGNGVEWTNAGGGWDSDVEVIDFNIAYDSATEEDVLIHVSKSSQEVLQIVLSQEKQVIARLCRVAVADHSKIVEVTVFPFSYMYYSDGIYPVMFFNWGAGSGGGGSSITGDEEDWSSSLWDRVELE